MPRPLTKTDVVERLHSLPLQSYALISNVAKGIALGASGLVMLQIFSKFGAEWMRILPWCASLLAVFVSYTKWMRGTLLSNANSNSQDTLLPLVMGVLEFILFAILGNEESSCDFDVWLNWPMCFALHSFAAFLLIRNRLKLTEEKPNFSEDFPEKLPPLFLEWLRRDARITSAIGVMSITFWGIVKFIVMPCYGTMAASISVFCFAGFWFVALWIPIAETEKQLHQIDGLVSE